MPFPFKTIAGTAFPGLIFVALLLPAQAQITPSIRSVQVLRGGTQVEIEIESSAPIVPQTNELGGPNRLLVDFVNAKPGVQLRGLQVNRAEVKDLRVGLFSANPPVTRIVVDLNSPQPYQVFPSGRTTIIKIGVPAIEEAGIKPSSGNVVEAANDPSAPVPPSEPPKPTLSVSFEKGLLSINSDRATLADILNAVRDRTGAEITVPPGTGQEGVVVNLGPALAPAVLSQLLKGSKFNFLILSSPKNPGDLDQVILTPRSENPAPAQAAAQQPPPPPEPPTESAEDKAQDPRFRPIGRPGRPPFRDPNPPTDGGVPADQPNNDGPQ